MMIPGGRRPVCRILVLMALLAFPAPSLGQIPYEDLARVVEMQRIAKLQVTESTLPSPTHSVSQKLLGGSLHLYRSIFSSQDASRCQFEPSCSHFAEEAVMKAGTVRGILAASDRVQRCHPFAGRSYTRSVRTGKLIDPVESYFAKHTGGDSPRTVGCHSESRKSPAVAVLLSAVLPGSGKIYAGRGVDGLSSALATGAPAFFSIRGFRRDGASSIRGWLEGSLSLGFYLGNLWGSAVAARQAGHERTRAAASVEEEIDQKGRSAEAVRSGRWMHGSRGFNIRGTEADPAGRYEIALGVYAAGGFAESTARFLDLADSAPDSQTAAGARFFQSLSHAEQHQWSSARNALCLFARAAGAGPDSSRLRAGIGYLEAVDPKPAISPRKAQALSILVPGAGQVYAHHYRKGITSLGVNLAFGYYTYRTARSGSYFEMALLALPVFWRYYRGNINSARRCAEDYNRSRGQETLSGFRDLLGISPAGDAPRAHR